MTNYGKICGVLCAIALLATLNPGGAHADEPPVAVEQPPQKEKHYQLKRRVIRVTLTSNPLVRVQCTLRDYRGVSETVVWDPAERRGLTRYVLLPRDPAGPAKDDVLECVSDRLQLGNPGGTLAYSFPLAQFKESMVSIKGDWKSLADGKSAGISLTIEASDMTGVVATTAGDEKQRAIAEVDSILDQLGGFEQTTSLRSLDPTAALVSDLLGTLATVALERASEAGKQYIRRFLKEQLCTNLTVNKITQGLPDTELSKRLIALKWHKNRYILQTTCALIETARIDELASARDAMWRAVALDSTVLGGAILESAIVAIEEPTTQWTPESVPKGLARVVRSAGDLMRATIAGNTATTERDVQVLILKLGRIGLGESHGWECGLEAGAALLRECLRDQSCSADELQRLIEQERQLSQGDPECDVGRAANEWPELPTLLGRMADVLRPAPGIDARLTAATAFELVLDVAEHVIKHSSKDGKKRDEAKLEPGDARYAYTLAMIRTLRAVVAVVRGEDPAPAIIELATVLQFAITDYCDNRENTAGKCAVPVTTAILQRAFAVVSAVASYGASYRGNDSGEDAPEELQKQRAEERKKALETVIDAFTDRSQRANNWVLSLGANVALGYQHRINVFNDSGKNHQFNLSPVSLPMGLAVQQLPGADRGNLHMMFTFIDLAQYLTVSREQVGGMGMEDGEGEDDIQTPKPELATALRLGAEIGLLFGEPSFPLSLTVHGAWIPRVTYEGSDGRDESRSEFRFGASLGVYVPFLDLN